MKKNILLIVLILLLLLVSLFIIIKNKADVEKEPPIEDEVIVVEEPDDIEEEKRAIEKELEEKYKDEDLDSMDVSINLDEEPVVKDIEVSEDEVLIKFPLVSQGAFSQKGLDRLILQDKNILDGTLNEDRSITLKMKKSVQEEIASSMLVGLRDNVLGLAEDKEFFPYIDKAEIDDEVTSIKISVSGEYDEEQLKRIAFELGVPAVTYKAYSLNDTNVTISFIDNNEIVLELNCPDDLPQPNLEKPVQLTEEELKALEEKSKLTDDGLLEEVEELEEGNSEVN